MTGVSIVVPVGPQKQYLDYLPECLNSIDLQVNPNDEILIIDDMASLSREDIQEPVPGTWSNNCLRRHIRNDWLLGCADSWNRGVVLATNDLVLLMGSDDKLLPGALDALRVSYAANKGKPAWYNLTIQIDEGPDAGIHAVFNNAAAVTKELWKLTGGFPPSGFAAPDALLISVMMVHMPDRLIQVKEGVPLYWCRVHDAQDTRRQAGPFNWEVIRIRDIETARWEKPAWTTPQ